MQRLFHMVMLVAISFTLIAGSVGCESSRETRRVPAERTTRPAPAPAPAPAPSQQGEPGLLQVGPGQVSAVGYYPTGSRANAAARLQKIAPRQVAVGENFEYWLHVTNLADCPLKDVVVTDEVKGVVKINSSDPALSSSSNGVYAWNLGTLLPGQSKTIKVNATATATGDITRCGTITYIPVLCLATAVVQPAITLSETAPAQVLLCDTYDIVITVSNSGTGPAQNVVITDKLPAGVTTLDGKDSVNVNVGTLEAGQSRAYKVTVKASKPGTYAHTSNATATGNLKASSNSSTVVRQPVLTLTADAPELRYLGRQACHTYTVKNTSNVEATNTSVVINVAGGQFATASAGGTYSNGQVTFNLGTLAAGASKQVEVCVNATQAGQITSSGRATAVCAEAVASNGATKVEGISALLLEVVDLDDPVEIGNQTTYEIDVTNQGSSTATNIVIKATLPGQMTFVSAGGQTTGNAAGQVVTFAPLANLPPKATAKWRVTIQAKAAADARFAVEMTADQLTKPVNETESTNLYE